jgi:hypothetical protein
MNPEGKKMTSGNKLSLFLVLFLGLGFCLSSAGCIKQVQHYTSGYNGSQTESSGSRLIPALSPTADIPVSAAPAVPSESGALPYRENFRVEEVDPIVYITPDPYRLPYREHGSWTTREPDRVPKIPQFTKKIILRSNSTAFRVNVTKGPLVIDLTYCPLHPNPDNTHAGSKKSEETGDTEDYGVSTNSFVFSNAEITVIDEIAGGAPVAKEGYNGIYSSDLYKQITVYREGSFVITLTGNFIDVDMAIITGSAREIDLVPATEPDREEQG